MQGLVWMVGYAGYLGRERTIGVVPSISRKDILPLSSHSDVNWMLWLMELIWSSITLTKSFGIADKISSKYLFQTTVGTGSGLKGLIFNVFHN